MLPCFPATIEVPIKGAPAGGVSSARRRAGADVGRRGHSACAGRLLRARCNTGLAVPGTNEEPFKFEFRRSKALYCAKLDRSG
ncbi:hypothetical protein CCHR01_09100 [Colletotrichum chrysophilum]|uniref:Uncharacterized protein n=1 Tax=Colletotrichum chrysophilum TaxID=1836956 RepID=A0AAD9AIH3_9PEZI|nr:hypothetical protein CCHR01_09100 [Colletotrichum chrysophilum]